MRIGQTAVTLRVGNTAVLAARLGTTAVLTGALPPVVEEWYFTNATTLYVGVLWPEDDFFPQNYLLISANGITLAGAEPVVADQGDPFYMEFDGLDEDAIEAIANGVQLIAVQAPGTASEERSMPSAVFSAVWEG